MSSQKTLVSSSPRRQSDTIYYVLLGLVVVGIAILRIRLLNFPLERDEGGFAYMANLLLQGIPPYTEAYDFKPPGLYATYALFLFLFGKSASGIHTGLMLTNLASMVTLFFLTKRLFNSATGVIAALVYGFLSLSPSLLGFAAHATHFVVFWMLTGYLLLLYGTEKKKPIYLLLSGIAFGCSILIKQPAVVFCLFALFDLLFLDREKTFSMKSVIINTSTLIAGIVIPLGITALWLTATGAFSKFYFWNVTYGLEFSSRISFTEAVPFFMIVLPQVMDSFFYVWILAGIGILFLVTPLLQQRRLEIILFTVCSFLAVSIGYQFRSHYFILLLPALAICSGVVFFVLSEKLQRNKHKSVCYLIPTIVLLIPLGLGVILNQSYFFTEDTTTLSKQFYFPNTFSESQHVADFVQSRTSENDYIAILGSEPQIPFLADRKSATKYLFTYFFMEPHALSLQMEQEMQKEIEQNSPKILILFNDQISWGTRPTSEMGIFDWANNYIKEHYDIVGLVDMISPSHIVYKWDNDIRTYPRARDANILIFQRHK